MQESLSGGISGTKVGQNVFRGFINSEKNKNMSVKHGVIMQEEKKNALQGIHGKLSEVQRKLLRLYLQYVNPRLAKTVEVCSEPKLFIRKLLPVDSVRWLTIAAAVTGLLVLLSPEAFWHWQIALFLGVFFLGPMVVRMLMGIRATFYNLLVAYPGKHLLHQEILLEQPIVNGMAEVELHGETWKLMGDDCPAGSRVRVVAIKDHVLFVLLLG